jgi:hypothetical protein
VAALEEDDGSGDANDNSDDRECDSSAVEGMVDDIQAKFNIVNIPNERPSHETIKKVFMTPEEASVCESLHVAMYLLIGLRNVGGINGGKVPQELREIMFVPWMILKDRLKVLSEGNLVARTVHDTLQDRFKTTYASRSQKVTAAAAAAAATAADKPKPKLKLKKPTHDDVPVTPVKTQQHPKNGDRDRTKK